MSQKKKNTLKLGEDSKQSTRHTQPSLMSIQEKLGLFIHLVKRAEEEENAKKDLLNRKPLSFM